MDTDTEVTLTLCNPYEDVGIVTLIGFNRGGIIVEKRYPRENDKYHQFDAYKKFYPYGRIVELAERYGHAR